MLVWAGQGLNEDIFISGLDGRCSAGVYLFIWFISPTVANFTKPKSL